MITGSWMDDQDKLDEVKQQLTDILVGGQKPFRINDFHKTARFILSRLVFIHGFVWEDSVSADWTAKAGCSPNTSKHYDKCVESVEDVLKHHAYKFKDALYVVAELILGVLDKHKVVPA